MRPGRSAASPRSMRAGRSGCGTAWSGPTAAMRPLASTSTAPPRMGGAVTGRSQAAERRMGRMFMGSEVTAGVQVRRGRPCRRRPAPELRVWAGEALPPRPTTREAAPPLPRHPGGGTAGEMRVGAFAAWGGYAAQRQSRRTPGGEIEKRVEMRLFRRTRGATTVECDVVPDHEPTPADPLTPQALILPPGAALPPGPSSPELRVWVGEPPSLPPLELRAWAGEALPPRPTTREAAPPLPRHPGGGTAGEMRVGAFAVVPVRVRLRVPVPGPTLRSRARQRSRSRPCPNQRSR